MPRIQGKTDGSLALSETVEQLATSSNVRAKKPAKSTDQKPVNLENIGKIVAITADEITPAAVSSDPNSVVEISISELHAPEFNPFNIADNEAMDRLVESIKQHGIHEPGLARTRINGGYELLVGQRRKRACELANIPTMPVIIREFDNDSAAIVMVDSNLEHRDRLLPSEKAWAFRIKLDALYHKGVKGSKLSAEIISDQTGESRSQIFRQIRLTELIIGLLDKVDSNQIAFNPAIELSYLSQIEQGIVDSAVELNGIKPSLSQAVRLKKLKQSGKLTEEIIHSVLSEEKKSKANSADKEINRFRKFFPADYTERQIDKVITELLTAWQREHKTPEK